LIDVCESKDYKFTIEDLVRLRRRLDHTFVLDHNTRHQVKLSTLNSYISTIPGFALDRSIYLFSNGTVTVTSKINYFSNDDLDEVINSFRSLLLKNGAKYSNTPSINFKYFNRAGGTIGSSVNLTKIEELELTITFFVGSHRYYQRTLQKVKGNYFGGSQR